ncbi:hypothetical protein [Luteolibacter sp. Populi]|uniref:DUF7035 domain-containing protein n=1 Tax=Luteolibacter sp. Populi TaxID=3230487 RepID=UPI0034655302
MKTLAAFLLLTWTFAASSALALDPAAPEITSIAIAPDPVDISTGSQAITVTLHITDDEDGFSNGHVDIYNPDDNSVRSSSFDDSARTGGTAADGTYEVDVTVPFHAIPGTWRVDVSLHDTTGHEQHYGPEPFPVPTDRYFEVVNTGTVDGDAPDLATFSTTPRAVPAGGTIKLQMQITDEIAGFAYGYPYFYNAQDEFYPDLVSQFDQSVRQTGDEFDGIYELEVALPEDAPPGLWKVEMYFEDAAGNSGFHNAGTFIVSAGGTSPSSIGNAVDAVQYPWTSPAPAWFYQTAVTRDGVDAAQSGPTPDDGESGMEATFTGPGTLTFHWRADSQEGFDFLKFEGPEFRSISGDTGWIEEAVTIPEGRHTVRWIYAKSPFDAVGQDCGWVDQVRFTADADAELPALQTLTISPNPVDISETSRSLTLTFDASDDHNGIIGGNLRVFDPSNDEFTFLSFDDSSRTAGDALHGTYTLHALIPSGASPGTWRVEIDLIEIDSALTSTYGTEDLPFPNPGDNLFLVSNGGSVYANFTTLHGLTGDDALPSADPDDDGFNNATELMLGTNPSVPTANGPGLLSLTRDATHIHLSFTIDGLQSIASDGTFLELGGGTSPFRLTGQIQNHLDGAWTNVLPVLVSGSTYRISLPLASGTTGFIRLFFEED